MVDCRSSGNRSRHCPLVNTRRTTPDQTQPSATRRLLDLNLNESAHAGAPRFREGLD